MDLVRRRKEVYEERLRLKLRFRGVNGEKSKTPMGGGGQRVW